jgi:diaminopimelate decarboxylase
MGNHSRKSVTSDAMGCAVFSVSADGQLSWKQVNECAKTYGDSFYVFDELRLRENFARLTAAFAARYHDTRIAYSYKTNYTPAICKIIDEMGGYAEVVSEMEYDLARELGISGQHIIYNGPYKSFGSVRRALYAGAIVNLDSMRDYTTVMMLASEAPEQRLSVGLRCNFALSEDCVSRFGFDTNGSEFRRVIDGIRSSRNVCLSGLHCHFPNRDLASFRLRTLQMLDIASRVFPSAPAFLNLGGGFFGEMPESMQHTYKIKPPDFNQYAETICDLLSRAYTTSSRKPTLYIEPGTALVADTLKFYTRIINIKNIRGRGIATVAGSLFNISPHSRVRHLPVRVIRSQGDNAAAPVVEKYDIAGYTCIEDDFLTMQLSGPLDVGDFLEYRNVGSYSIVMKPPFILPNVPILRISDRNAEVFVIRHGETATNLFQSFSGFVSQS